MAERKPKEIYLKKAANGFILQGKTEYGNDGDPQIFTDFEDAIVFIAGIFDETVFANTVKDAQAMTQAMTALCNTAIAPKLLAIESRVNPGIENVVKGNGEDEEDAQDRN